MGPIEMRMGSGEGSTMRNFIVCTIHLIIVRVIKSRRLMWARHETRMVEGRSAFKILTGKKPLRRRRMEDNIRMDLKEIGINTGNCVDWAQDWD